MLKKLLTVAATLTLALVMLTLVVLLGTVNQTDAIRFERWIDATFVTNPLPGQLYAVSKNGVVETQICALTKNDFRVSLDKLPGRTFVNRLGETVPVVMRAAQSYLQAPEEAFSIDYRLEWPALEREYATQDSLNLGVQRVLEERDFEQLERKQSASAVAEAKRLEGCANAIKQTFKEGRDVCQLTEVIREQRGPILAVRFGARCLVLDAESISRPLPRLKSGSFWTDLKIGLDLVERNPSVPGEEVVAGGPS